MEQYNETTMMDIDDVLEVQSSVDGMDDDILHDIPSECSNDPGYPGIATGSHVHRMTDTERPQQTTSNMERAELVVEGMPVEQPTTSPGTGDHSAADPPSNVTGNTGDATLRNNPLSSAPAPTENTGNMAPPETTSHSQGSTLTNAAVISDQTPGLVPDSSRNPSIAANLVQPVATAPTATSPLIEVDDDPANYVNSTVYTYTRVWPLNQPIFLPADNLPHVMPGEFYVPPFTVRYRLPQGVNTNIDKQTDAIRQILLKQLEVRNPADNAGVNCARSAEVTFPKQQGRRDERYFSVDVTADTPTNFETIKGTTFTLKSEKLDVIDVGPPTPANLITVTVNHLPSQNDSTNMGQLVAEQICKRYGAVTCHDVFQRNQEVTVGGKEEQKTSGTMVASVQFTEAPPHKFPDDLIRTYFPGWISIRHIPYQLYYVGRINHCNRCKADARTPHEIEQCPRRFDDRMCYRCREYGHAAASCPANSATGNEVQDPTVATATTSNSTAQPTRGIDASEGAPTATGTDVTTSDGPASGHAIAAMSNTAGTANMRTPESVAETPTVSSATPTEAAVLEARPMSTTFGSASDPEEGSSVTEQSGSIGTSNPNPVPTTTMERTQSRAEGPMANSRRPPTTVAMAAFFSPISAHGHRANTDAQKCLIASRGGISKKQRQM